MNNESSPEFEKAASEAVLQIATVMANNAVEAFSHVAHFESGIVPRSSLGEPPSKWILSDDEIKSLAAFGERR
jgi:hypothetical protein